MEESDHMGNPGDEGYFVDILNRYEKLVFSICFRMTGDYFDAEDLTQETFLALYQALPGFDGKNPKAYVTKIASNKCLDHLKKAERRAVATEGETLDAYPAAGREPEQLVMEDELLHTLYQACDGLRSPYREVALAYYCEGRTAAWIARSQGKKTKTVQTQIRRARSMLQKYLKKEEILWRI